VDDAAGHFAEGFLGFFAGGDVAVVEDDGLDARRIGALVDAVCHFRFRWTGEDGLASA
jgi:hypothetical protein